ncbi:MAG TPA: hypothetical protein VM686_38465, partial [Polyangiaceae bacterium]|nr:hypothetical protein [Polyangiaceae bacterium]
HKILDTKLRRAFPFDSDTWTLSVTHASNGLLVGAIGPVCLAIWRTKPIPVLFEVQRLGLASAVASAPGRAAFLCVVESEADPPDQAVREASAAMISDHGTRLAVCACVIEGSGFRAAITRTVLTGMALIARNAAPTRFFDSVTLASGWLGERLGQGRECGLAEQVELARKRL